jgi:endonuclease/exonuclease/phosphatase (EEP) superfamily protein YafD
MSDRDTATPPSNTEERGSSSRRPLSAWRVLTAVGIVGCVPTLAALAARLSWICELCVHFQVYYAVAFSVAAVIYLIGRRWKLAAVWLIFAIWNGAGLIPFYLGPCASAQVKEVVPNKSLRILVANVHTENRAHQKFIDLIQREQPDLIVAIEIDRAWTGALEKIHADYPYRRTIPRSDNFGIGVYSRRKLASLEPQNIGPANVPSMVGHFVEGPAVLTLIATHSLPPVNAEYSRERNAQLTAIGAYVRGLTGPVVVCGDLNTTPWSPFFQDLLQSSGLRDGRSGFGIKPTWTGNRFFVCLPIDHVLVTPDITVSEFRVGGEIGSDHFPVIVTLRVPRPGTAIVHSSRRWGSVKVAIGSTEFRH